MSVVGPRPWAVSYIPYFTKEERKRHLVRPGLSGWAQVNGRTAANWDERLKYDTKMEDTLVITGFGKMFYYSDKYSLIFLQGLKKYLDAGKKANLLQVGSRESQADSLLNKANVAQDVLQTTGLGYSQLLLQKNHSL